MNNSRSISTMVGTIGAVTVAAVFLSSPKHLGADEASDDWPSSPPILVAHLADVEPMDDSTEDEDADAEADHSPTVLNEGLVLLDDIVLLQLDPWEVEIEELPTVRLELFDEAKFDVEFWAGRSRWVDAVPLSSEGESNPPDSFVLNGRIVSHADGSEASGYIVLLSRPGAVYITGHLDGFGELRMRQIDGVLYETTNFWATAIAHDCDHHDEQPGAGGGFDGMFGGLAGGGDCDGPCPIECTGEDCDDGCRVDIMVLYTPKTKQEINADSSTPDIEGFIASEVAKLNSVLDNSGIHSGDEPLVRLVYMGEVDHDGDAGLPPAILIDEFRDCLVVPWNNCLDDVHDLRNAMRADLVALLAHMPTDTFSMLGNAIRPTAFSLAEESTGFSASYWQAADLFYTLVHEVGHNLGFGHVKWECGDYPTPCDTSCDLVCQPELGPYQYTYVQDFAFGWNSSIGGREFATVMGGCAHTGVRVPHYSNPFIEYCESGACAATGEEQCADNALAMRGSESYYGTRFLVAQHRTSHDTTDTTTMVQNRMAIPPSFPEDPANNSIHSPDISWNGQDAVFVGRAGEWGFDSNGNPDEDIYLYNSESGTIDLISHAFVGGAPLFNTSTGYDSSNPVISGHRGVVAYTRRAAVNGQDQIIAYVRPAHKTHPSPEFSSATELIASSGNANAGNRHSGYPSINTDGTHIAFESLATNLVDYCEDCFDDVNCSACHELSKIYVRDIENETTTLVSRSTDGTIANADCFRPAISETGRFVAFEGTATNLGEFDTEGYSNIWVHNREVTGVGAFDQPGNIETTLASTAWDPLDPPDGDSKSVSMSGDGNIIAYQTRMTNVLPPSDGVTIDPDVWNVVVTNHQTESTEVISLEFGGNESSNGDSINPHVSFDGKWVVFSSNSSDLHPAYDTMAWRIYIHDIEGNQIDRVLTVNDVGGQSSDTLVTPVISHDGRFVAFGHEPDGGGIHQVFLHDRGVMLPGDLNGDGIVDEKDIDILYLNWCQEEGCCECCAADLTGDGKVDCNDLHVLLENMDDPPLGCSGVEQ